MKNASVPAVLCCMFPAFQRCAVVVCLHICRKVDSVPTFLRVKADCFYKGGKSVNLSMEIAYDPLKFTAMIKANLTVNSAQQQVGIHSKRERAFIL